jgi:hypothetical protein
VEEAEEGLAMRKRMDVGMKRGHVLIRIPYSWRPEAPRGPPPQRYASLLPFFLSQTDNIQSPVVMPLVPAPSVDAAVAVVDVVTAPVALGPSATTVTATLALGKLNHMYQPWTILLTLQKRAREAGRSRLGLPGGYLRVERREGRCRPRSCRS